MEWQQFKVTNMGTKCMPELWLQRGKRHIFAIFSLINIVTRETAIESGVTGARSLARIQVGSGNEWQKRHHPFGHRDIDFAPLPRLHPPHYGSQDTNDGHITSTCEVGQLRRRHHWLALNPTVIV